MKIKIYYLLFFYVLFFIAKASLAENRKITPLVFVSFSMPRESLRSLIKEAEAFDAHIYIKGLVNNSFSETIGYVSKLCDDQVGGILIDPTLFKKYSIKKVPAFVLDDGENYNVIYGNVSLRYALNKIRRFASLD